MRQIRFSSIVSVIVSLLIGQSPVSGKELESDGELSTNTDREAENPEPENSAPRRLEGHVEIHTASDPEGGAREAVLQGHIRFDDDTVSQLEESDVIGAAQEKPESLELFKGSLLLAPTNHINVKIALADIGIEPGAIVYIRETGETATILNLHDDRHRSVNVSCGNTRTVLPPGRQLVLTRKPELTFDEANPVKGIWFRSIHELHSSPDARAYLTIFSTLSALRTLPSVKQMARTDSRNGRNIIKTAAAVFAVARDPQPFRYQSSNSGLQPVGAVTTKTTSEKTILDNWRAQSQSTIIGQQLLGILEKANSQIEFNSQDTDALYTRGYLLGTIGCTRSAIQDLTKAIESSPQSGNLYTERGLCYIDLGSYDRALRDLNSAVHLNPRSANARLARGRLNLWMERPQLALADLLRCQSDNLEFSTHLPGELQADHYHASDYYIGICYHLLGRQDEATRHMQTSASAPKTSSGYLHRYADQPLDSEAWLDKIQRQH